MVITILKEVLGVWAFVWRIRHVLGIDVYYIFNKLMLKAGFLTVTCSLLNLKIIP